VLPRIERAAVLPGAIVRSVLSAAALREYAARHPHDKGDDDASGCESLLHDLAPATYVSAEKAAVQSNTGLYYRE
jgi:hypothetical protein